MRDTEGKFRWILASVGVVFVLVLLTTAARGIGTRQALPMPTPLPTAAPQSRPNDHALQAHELMGRRLEDLYDQANAMHPADEPGQQRLLSEYRQLILLASGQGGGIPSGCTVARRAWQVQAFLWAKEAWDVCYLEGEASSRDYGFYVGILRNLGRIWSEESSEERVRYKGATYLVACVEVVDRYRLTLWECQQDLERFLGESAWPPAAVSPLLPLQ